MDRFQELKTYVAVAEEQGFAAAARRLDISPPAVTRSVAALEARLGIQLLARTTRFVRATEAGLRYLEDAKRILDLLAQADEAAVGINAEPAGHLTVTAPVLFGRLYVMPAINEYLRRYPAVTVEAVFLDRAVNLVEEGIDVAVRIGALPDSSMRALRVGSVHHTVCAAPAYLDQHGRPQHPSELNGHALVASTAGGFAPGWRFLEDSQVITVPIKPRVSASTNDAAVEAAIEGLGITRLLSYQLAEAISKGELEVLLDQFTPQPSPLHILHRENRRGSARVRGFIDLLADRLRADRRLNPESE